MTEPTGNVRVLIEQIAKWIVDAPDQVFVDHLDDDVIDVRDRSRDDRRRRPVGFAFLDLGEPFGLHQSPFVTGLLSQFDG